MLSTECMNSDSQLYNSLELAKTFQQWVVREKRERQVSIILLKSIKESSLGIWQPSCVCNFYLYYGLGNWILELQYHIKFDASECNEKVCEFWGFQPDQTESFLTKSMASNESIRFFYEVLVIQGL